MINPETFLASLNNVDHAWVMRGRNSHQHEEHRLIGSGESLSTIEIMHDLRTYQLQSEPLDLHLVCMAELENGVLHGVWVIYRGTNIDITLSALLTKLDAMAATAISEVEQDLVTRLTP